MLQLEASKKTNRSADKYRAGYLTLVYMVNNSLGGSILVILNILALFGFSLMGEAEKIITIVILPITMLLTPVFETLSLACGFIYSGVK